MKNRVNLMGRLGQDARLIITKDETFMIAFSVATGTDKWHNIVFFDEKKIEKLEGFLKAGVLVDIEGYLNPHEYNKGGNTYKTSSVVANRILILDKPHTKQPQTKHSEKQSITPPPDELPNEFTSSVNDPSEFDDDIPF